MRLTLLIPYLFTFADEAGLPKALRRLSRAQHCTAPGDWLDARLCRLFGIDNTPIAALSQVFDGGEKKGHWLRADPIHMTVQQNSAGVVESSRLGIRQDEADAVIEHLNRFFAPEALEWFAPRPERWYLKLPQAPQACFTPLPLVLGRSVPTQPVVGDEGKLWRRRLTEIQMSLFDLPVNEAREASGQLSINHLWLWGEGDYPAAVERPDAVIWGDHPTLHALALASGKECLPIPSTFKRWREKADARSEHVVVLDRLCSPAWAQDLVAWKQGLDELSEHWLEDAMDQRGIELVMEAFEPERGVVYRWQMLDRLKIWKTSHVGY